MSKVIKLQQKFSVQAAPRMETEEFLSFEDFWQGKGAGKAPARMHRPKDPREIAAAEAAALIEQTRQQAEEIRREAHAQGLAAGEASGQAEGLRLYRERIDALDALLRNLETQQADLLRRHEADLLVLTKTMVDRLVHHEVSTNPLVVQACLKKAMEFVVENSSVQVHINGEDFNRLKQASMENPRLIEGKSRLQLVEDSGVAVGGCLVKTGFGEIDATLESCRENLYAGVDKAFLAALADDAGGRDG